MDDDIARLQALPPRTFWRRKNHHPLTGQNVDQKWFVVYGASAQETLERLEAFTRRWRRRKKAGELTRWRTLPLNSLARQNSDLHLLRNAAPTVMKMLQSTGLNAVH